VKKFYLLALSFLTIQSFAQTVETIVPVQVTDSTSSPTVSAPNPTVPASQVISLFSGVYNNVPVNTWLTTWSQAELQDVEIDGNFMKKYTFCNYAAVETNSPANQINANPMNYFNVDLWTANSSVFKVKLVDFGANGVYDGVGVADDKEHELTYTLPQLEQWIHFHIPLSDFTNLVTRGHIAQIFFISNHSTLFIDNVYFSSEDGFPNPLTAAPTPTEPAQNVYSLFSNAYTNVPVDTWRTNWSASTFDDVQIAGNATKRYTYLNYVAIEKTTQLLDLSDLQYINMDVWSSDFTYFKIKLVDLGANAVFGGGDDVEHELTFNAPAKGQWLHYHIALSEFTGLVTRQHVAQLILASSFSRVFVDNLYFSFQPVATKSLLSSNINMFPNPAQGRVQISGTEALEEISVFNALGQLVLSAQPKSTATQLDVQALPKGMYSVRMTAGGNSEVRKLMLE
jgi:hypothetical protein